MNLEALPKYYSPKSPKLSDDAPATGTGCLTITDVMAAQGMVQSKAPLGLALFLAKVGVQDPQFAIEGLLNYAMALDNPTLNNKVRKWMTPTKSTTISNPLRRVFYYLI
ncbi:antitermination protein [Escherichia coli]